MIKKITKDQAVQVLSVGTRILIKDVMDQYLRSLGEVKTYYASKLSSAVEAFQAKQPNMIFCEQSFADGGAAELIAAIGGLHAASDCYFVLAVESHSDSLHYLALELGVDEILVKPFATEHLASLVERALEKRKVATLDWVKDMRLAERAYREKRFQEAEGLFAGAATKHWSNPGVLLQCADFFLARNQPKRAHHLLEKVLQDVPESIRAQNLLGLTLRRLGDLRGAAARLEKAAAMSPLNSQRLSELADTYLMLADEQVTAALRLEPESTSLLLKRAQLQLQRRDYGGLVSYLDAKRGFLSEAGKKEADAYIALAKKLGGLK